MTDTQKQIFSYSERNITKLQLLATFFEEELVFKIFVRTQVIDRLFKSNPELDIYKLNLFHVQYSESIIELLKKVKINNEKNLVQTLDEIQVNAELIEKLSNSMHLEESFENAREGHTHNINKALEKLYLNLSDYSRDNPFSKTIREFSTIYAPDFFYEVVPEVIDAFTDHEPEKIYKNGYGAIEKKLMGLECKHKFRNVFYCGLKAGTAYIEIFRLADFIVEDDDNEYFVFYPERNIFLGCTAEAVKKIDIKAGVSKKAKIILELHEKNVKLKQSLPQVKINIPAEVMNLLTEYYSHIEKLNFLDLIDDFDIQANILKTMLNTDSI